MRTVYEERARASKAFAIVEAVDRFARKAGLDPYSDAEKLAVLLQSFTDDQRTDLAVGCGQYPPSNTTWSLVIARVKARAEWANQDPFERCVSS